MCQDERGGPGMLGVALQSHCRRGGLWDVSRSPKFLVCLSIERSRSGFPTLPVVLGGAWGQDSWLSVTLGLSLNLWAAGASALQRGCSQEILST